MSKISPKWEEVLDQTRRMKVLGGWVFETWTKNYDNVITATTCCFIPDPEHKWEIE